MSCKFKSLVLFRASVKSGAFLILVIYGRNIIKKIHGLYFRMITVGIVLNIIVTIGCM